MSDSEPVTEKDYRSRRVKVMKDSTSGQTCEVRPKYCSFLMYGSGYSEKTVKLFVALVKGIAKKRRKWARNKKLI